MAKIKHENYLPASGRDWVKARTTALIRDHYQCQAHQLGLCDEPCQAPRRKLCVHHIKRRIDGGTHDLDNLITVCYAHHCDIHPHLLKQKKMVIKSGYEFAGKGDYEFLPREWHKT